MIYILRLELVEYNVFGPMPIVVLSIGLCKMRETVRVISRILHMVNLLDVDYCPRLCRAFRANRAKLGVNTDA